MLLNGPGFGLPKEEIRGKKVKNSREQVLLQALESCLGARLDLPLPGEKQWPFPLAQTWVAME